MSLYLGSEKVENVTAQITLPVEPSNDLPLADGTASAGVSKKFSRADHVHPKQEIPVKSVNGKTGAVSLTSSDVGAISSTLTGTAGQVLTKTADGQEWADAPVDENSVLLKNINITLPVSGKLNRWYSITYGNGKFVAVSDGSDTAAYSTDGITWIQSTLPLSAKWESVTYGNGKFVAVANGSTTAAYSTDGINWVQSNLPTKSKWSSVTYGDGKFVAVAMSSSVTAYSTDGINWVQSKLPAMQFWISVTYGNGKFVAFARGSDIAAYSTDGISWVQSTLPMYANWQSVTYGNSKFVAVASSGGDSTNAITAYSENGIDWIQSTPPSTGWGSVAYGNGKFVTLAYGSNIAAYSTDGINWTESTLPISANWNSVTHADGKFIAVALGSTTVAYSTDGITWTSTVSIIQYPNGTDIHEQIRTTLQIPEPESEVFICNIRPISSIFVCDKEFNEIKSAYDAGKICIAKNNQHNYYLASISVQSITFVNIEDKKLCQFSIRSGHTANYSEITLATPPTARKVTLTTSGWSNNQQTVTCTGVSSSATSQEIRVMPADASKTSAYVSCGVSCVAQASNSLTFACDKVPTTAIDVYVVMQSLNFQG